MKKIIPIVLLMTCAYLHSYSQEFAIGIKGGLNLAKFDVEDAGGSIENKTGFHGGAFALFKFSKIGIQPEVIFSQQGTKFKFDSQDLESNFSYINIPVMVKFYLVGGLNLQAGPQFGFLTKAEGIEYDEQTEELVDGRDVKDLYKKSDVSLGLGAGWDLPFGLTIDARYNLGLSKIDDSEAAAEAKNQVIQISVGFKLIKFGK